MGRTISRVEDEEHGDVTYYLDVDRVDRASDRVGRFEDLSSGWGFLLGGTYKIQIRFLFVMMYPFCVPYVVHICIILGLEPK